LISTGSGRKNDVIKLTAKLNFHIVTKLPHDFERVCLGEFKKEKHDLKRRQQHRGKGVNSIEE